MALTAAPPASGDWGRWPHHQHSSNDYVMMDHGIVPYQPRAATPAPLQRPVMAPQYSPYGVAAVASISTPKYQPYSASVFQDSRSYTGSSPMVDASHKPELERPGHRIAPPVSERRDISSPQDNQPLMQSPSMKSDASNNKTISPLVNPSLTAKTITPNVAVGDNRVDFNTDVDALMKAIQSKRETEVIVKKAEDEARQQIAAHRPQQPPVFSKSPDVGFETPEVGFDRSSPLSPSGGPIPNNPKPRDNKPATKKRYVCEIAGCQKSFSQKTHLAIHRRAHTGEQPYACKHAGCDRTFSQLGNLKTHERRHTGEKPFECEICGRRFTQRGNVKAHKVMHSAQKPYICRLENCFKDFSQLGNLKSHMNKFHAKALKDLTTKFATIADAQNASEQEKELWEYFATLYKNSNKGIKGRGKDRKVGPVRQAHQPSTTIPSPYLVQQPPNTQHCPLQHHQHPLSGIHNTSSLAAYSMSRTTTQPAMMNTYAAPVQRDAPQAYDMFNMGAAARAGNTSAATMYDEDHGRDLAFGGRMYYASTASTSGLRYPRFQDMEPPGT